MNAEADAARTTQRSPLERALTFLVAVSTRLKPDDLGDAAVEAGQLLGGRDVELHLVDISQRMLMPLIPTGEPRAAGVPVDGSSAGEAYRTESVVVEPSETGTRLWVPITDSAERVGILGATVDHFDDQVRWEWSLLTSLIGELVVTKSRYGDAISNSRRIDDVVVAAELRWALLPPLTYTSDEVVVSGILEPAHDIAGDTFDYAVNGSRVHVALFDAMGHGLNASRLANLVVGTHRNDRRKGCDLVEDVLTMDETIRRQVGDSQFVTAQVASLDLASGELRSINAGHPPAMVFRADGSQDEVAGERCVPLGFGSAPSGSGTTQLRAGDVVLFHTDGVEEARSSDGEYFGAERLHRMVRSLLDDGIRPAEVLRLVVAALLQHQADLVDDASLVLLGWQVGEDAVAPSDRPPD